VVIEVIVVAIMLLDVCIVIYFAYSLKEWWLEERICKGINENKKEEERRKENVFLC
jgi:hypothetical protein